MKLYPCNLKVIVKHPKKEMSVSIKNIDEERHNCIWRKGAEMMYRIIPNLNEAKLNR